MGLERASQFLSEPLLHAGIKGRRFVPPLQCSDRSSSTVIAETALASLKNTH